MSHANNVNTQVADYYNQFAKDVFPHRFSNDAVITKPQIGVVVQVPIDMAAGHFVPEIAIVEGLDLYKDSQSSAVIGTEPFAMIFGDRFQNIEPDVPIRLRIASERVLRDTAGLSDSITELSNEAVIDRYGRDKETPLVIIQFREYDFHEHVRAEKESLENGNRTNFETNVPVNFGRDVYQILSGLELADNPIELITDNPDELDALREAGIQKIHCNQIVEPPKEFCEDYQDKFRHLFTENNIEFGLPGLSQHEWFAEHVDTVLPVIADLDGQKTPCHVVTFKNLSDEKDFRPAHFAIVFGDPSKLEKTNDVHMRIHARCLTGDNWGSERCDCGPQMQEAMKKMVEQGCGILMYTDQEGRGHGFAAKMYEYYLQMLMNANTYEASRGMGFVDDERSYEFLLPAISALTDGRAIALHTNNPDKIGQMRSFGVIVSREVRTGYHPAAGNKNYLATKADLGGHKLQINEADETPRLPRLHNQSHPGLSL